MQGVASVDGRISALAEASLPLCDRGYLFGQAVFETILVLEGRVVLWQEHVDRLLSGCRAARISPPNPQELWQECVALIRANVAQSGSVSEKMQLRLIVSGGVSPVLWEDHCEGKLAPVVAIFCRNISGLAPEVYQRGWRLMTVTDERSSSTIGIKSTSYLLPMLALARAREAGFDDALYVNAAHEITESTTASFLWSDSEGQLYTSPTAERCLPGTTLLGLRTALRSEGRDLHERILHLDKLPSIRLAWIASATRGLVPIREIDEVSYAVSENADVTSHLGRLLRAEQLRAATVT